MVIAGILLFGISLPLSATSFKYTKIPEAKLKELVKETKMLQNPMLTVTRGRELETVYHIEINVEEASGSKILEAFIDKKTGAIYLGGGYDKDGMKYSFPADVKKVNEAVAFSYGSGSKNLYIISDPECTYSRKFAKESKGKLTDYRINVILMPLEFHTNAKAMTDYIISGRDNTEKAARYTSILTNNDVSYKKAKVNLNRLQTYVSKSSDAISQLKVKGTPTFFLEENGVIETIGWGSLLR